MEGLLHFREDDSTFMEWFYIETVDVALVQVSVVCVHQRVQSHCVCEWIIPKLV